MLNYGRLADGHPVLDDLVCWADSSRQRIDSPNNGAIWTRPRNSAGLRLAIVDGVIAATALEHDLTIVTRNTKDFTGLGAILLDPWDAD